MDAQLIEINKIFRTAKTIAVLGFSKNSDKTSRQIADFLVSKGYAVYGVNPNIGRGVINGIEVFPKLTDIPFQIDIVDVFRRSADIPELVDDVLKTKPVVLWLQQGIKNDNAVKPIIEAGTKVFQDMCIAVYYNLCKVFN
ncbi:MAG: CoA-binding protein [bacterium]